MRLFSGWGLFMTEAVRPRPYLTLLAGILVTGSLGSVHAFSVFIGPLEATLGAARSDISLIYAMALVFLTATVLLGHRLYGLLPPYAIASGACLLAALGLWQAATSDSLLGIGLGYSLLFGGANGIGYGFALQLVAQALPERRGFAMGTVTAVYALGAMAFAKVFDRLIDGSDIGPALSAMAVVMICAAILIAVLLWLARASYTAAPAARSGAAAQRRRLALLWAGYGLGAAAGLMAIGHATGIVAAAGGASSQLVVGAMLIGLGNALGGFAAGWLADRWAVRRLLILLPLFSALVLFALTLGGGPATAIAGLCLIGFAYGAIIAAYPAAVAHYYGALQAPKVYGRVFTAWGLAGLGAPWLAGALYDASGNYSLALGLAGLAGLTAAACAWLLPSAAAAETG